MYHGYIARFRSAEPASLYYALKQLLPDKAAHVFWAYIALLLRDPGPMPYAGHGEHVTFTTDSGINHALIVGKDGNIRSPRPMIVLGVHYPREGLAPAGKYDVESPYIIKLGAEWCVPFRSTASLTSQMIEVYQKYIP